MSYQEQNKAVTEEHHNSLHEMMNNIAHQWRQPLSQINATVGAIDKILYEKNIHEAVIEEKLQEIEAITKNMSYIIDDFKKYYENNGVKEEFFLKNLLKETIATFQISLIESQITLEETIHCDGIYLAYESELKQVLLVLLNNAKDALMERNVYNAHIRVELLESQNSYMIKVYDNAGGIAKSVRDRMFDAYYTTKHRSQGSGIGLHMTRKIIEEKFQGSLSVENVGEGSCFTVTLPQF